MPADFFKMGDLAQTRGNLVQPLHRQDQRIATGDDDFTQIRRGLDIGKRRLDFMGCERVAFDGSDHFATKTKAAIDRTGTHQFQQGLVVIAVDQACGFFMRLIADGIIDFIRCDGELAQIRHKLFADRIFGIVCIH